MNEPDNPNEPKDGKPSPHPDDRLEPDSFFEESEIESDAFLYHTDALNESDLEIFEETLIAGLEELGLLFGPEQIDRMSSHYRALVHTNKTMNLTRITDPTKAAVKHYVDSLAPLVWAEEEADLPFDVRVLDVGTGGGFPAVPLAATELEWTFTAIDSTAKKIAFLREFINRMEIANLEAIPARSEHWNAPRPFELVIMRAVGRLAKCITQAARHVAKGGYLIAYKTAAIAQDEIDEVGSILKAHKLKAMTTFDYSLSLPTDFSPAEYSLKPCPVTTEFGEVLHHRLCIFQRK